jgi:GDP-D-mannose dehydratase
MGRAIDQDNRLEDHERRIKLMEDALEEMIQTRVHHVDLTDMENVKAEGVEVKPDKVPTEKRKKTTRKATATATT